jgi:hypothetical protein
MNKKDFWTLMLFNFVSVILLIECWCGLELALQCMCVWVIVSLLVHIGILKNYVISYSFVREDYTR